MRYIVALALAALLAGCTDDPAAPAADLAAGADVDSGAPDRGLPDPDIASVDGSLDAPALAPELEVTFLGVGGFLLRVGGDAVLTAPMYSNPSFTEVLFGTVESDRALIDKHLSDAAVRDVRAILVGHAHYDHLLDVPHVLDKTQGARIYGNITMKRLLAGLAPDRSPSCPPLGDSTGGGVSWPTVPRDRVIALDDPKDDRVDYRSCGGKANVCSGGGGGDGAWVVVPQSRVRIRALCSMHPPQFLAVHFGEGCADADLCEPPRRAGDWKEGATLAYLIDFLDAKGKPIYRVYYQDAPTNAPVGHVPAAVLAEKRVDLALLCVGNYDQVKDHPAAILANLDARYAIGGHWEDFFRKPSQSLQPIAFHDPKAFDARAAAALRKAPEKAAIVAGAKDATRHWVPDPGTRFRFEAE